MAAKLNFISLGPGDIELITIKALNLIKKSDILVVPSKSSNSFNRSVTYKILQKLFKEYRFTKKLYLLYTPMDFNEKTWIRQANEIIELSKKYEIISYVTLGDAAIYSSVYYILNKIKNINKALFDNSCVVPGITSFSLASAKIKKPLALGDTSIEILPLSNLDAKKTKIYMRPHLNNEYNLKEDGEIYTFINLDLEDESILKGIPKVIKKYLTLIIDFIK